MKLFLSLLSTVLFFGSSTQALTLVCKLTNYGGNIYFNEQDLKNWLPEQQTHVLDLRTRISHFKEVGFDGRWHLISDVRIHWHYIQEIKDKKGGSYNATYQYVYLRKKKKLIPIIRLQAGDAKDRNLHDYEVDGTSGTCEERP